jgi:organic radical activating enzyme
VWDLKKNKSICVYPFVCKHIETNQEEWLCTVGQHVIKSRQDIVDHMKQGLPISGCEVCYDLENKGIESHRVRETKKWIAKHGEPNEIDIKWLDIRNNIECNAKCKICNSNYSTEWQKETGDYSVKSYQYNFTDEELSNCVKFIQTGGEPTLSKEFTSVLSRLSTINPDCNIVIQTNGTGLPEEWIPCLQKLTNLTVQVSIDAVGLMLTYLRYPIKHNTILSTIEKLKQYCRVELLTTAYNLNIHRLSELIDVAIDLNLLENWTISMLNEPKHFRLESIPHDVRQFYKNNIDLCKYKINQNTKSIFKLRLMKQLDDISKLFDCEYDQNSHKLLSQILKEQDSVRTMNLADIDKFLNNWVHK